MNTRFYIFFTVLIFFFSTPIVGFSQEKISTDDGIRRVKTNQHQAKSKHYRGAKSGLKASLSLPFFEDFTQHKVYPYNYKETKPNDSLWINYGAFVNNTYCINPPSYGCVTLDGLSAEGKPYSYVEAAFGGADTLTSQPINLKNRNTSDSIYFSFFYQPQGNGDYPNIGDSLVLEFKSNTNSWITVWGIDGTAAAPINDTFIAVLVPVVNPIFYDSLFQFRFRNIATLSGNDDHWNIDYIRLDTNRTYNDYSVNDVAFTNIPTSPFANYFSMPWIQYFSNKTAETATSFKIDILNNWNSGRNLSYSCKVFDVFNAYSKVASYPSPSILINNNSFANPIPEFTPSYKDSVIFPPAINAYCTRLLEVNYYFNPGVFEINSNDTLKYQQKFSNYLAYDDGTAEKAYSVTGNLVKVAQEYNLNTSDTLKAIQIHWAHMNKDVSKKLFNLMIWKSLDVPGGVNDVEIHTMFFRSPIYVDALFDSVNGFATYVLDTPQYIGSGKFYIGWQQLQADELYVGFDANTDAHTHLYNHYGSGWSQSIIKGTVMMRPMFGGCIPAYTTAIESNNDDKLPIKIFPNPSNQIINISSGATSLKKVEISNVLGQPLIIQNINQQSESYYYDISSFIRGVYVIKLTLPNGTFKVSKFIKE